MAFPGSRKNFSRRRPTFLFIMSNESSSTLTSLQLATHPHKQGSDCQQWMSQTPMVTPFYPCAQQRTFSITWTILPPEWLPLSVFLILDKVPNMSLWPLCASPKKLHKGHVNITTQLSFERTMAYRSAMMPTGIRKWRYENQRSWTEKKWKPIHFLLLVNTMIDSQVNLIISLATLPSAIVPENRFFSIECFHVTSNIILTIKN
jgi:hypothetical protein